MASGSMYSNWTCCRWTSFPDYSHKSRILDENYFVFIDNYAHSLCCNLFGIWNTAIARYDMENNFFYYFPFGKPIYKMLYRL